MKQYEMISQIIFEAMINNYTEDIETLNKFATQLAKLINELYGPITIKYYHQQQWGTDNIYIKDKKTANLITSLTKRKTIYQKDIETLKELGFNLIQVINPQYEENNT